MTIVDFLMLTYVPMGTLMSIAICICKIRTIKEITNRLGRGRNEGPAIRSTS